MERTPSPSPRSRDLALRRLRGLTAGVAVAVFGVVGAATLPGKTASATASATTRIASTTISATPTTSTSASDSTASSSTATATTTTPAHAVSGGS